MGTVRAVAVDGVVTIDEQIVLLQRAHPPEQGEWVLPGGIVEPKETLRSACQRELQEEVGLDVWVGRLIGLYDDPHRDDRGNISVAFRCRTNPDATPVAGAEADDVDVFPVHDRPPLGFDHEAILRDALVR